jgi:2-iminobutanoate/2-iminopropanoate deaminase
MNMRKLARIVVPALLGSLMAACAAQSDQNSGGFNKQAYNYSEWAKGLFSEVVSVSHPGRIIFFGGVGAEDETARTGGKILYLGDFSGQCLYAWDKIKRSLAKQGATLADVDKATTYITDIRYLQDSLKCRAQVFGTTPQPAGTLVSVSQLAWPGMLYEVDITAVTAQ